MSKTRKDYDAQIMILRKKAEDALNKLAFPPTGSEYVLDKDKPRQIELIKSNHLIAIAQLNQQTRLNNLANFDDFEITRDNEEQLINDMIAKKKSLIISSPRGIDSFLKSQLQLITQDCEAQKAILESRILKGYKKIHSSTITVPFRNNDMDQISNGLKNNSSKTAKKIQANILKYKAIEEYLLKVKPRPDEASASTVQKAQDEFKVLKKNFEEIEDTIPKDENEKSKDIGFLNKVENWCKKVKREVRKFNNNLFAGIFQPTLSSREQNLKSDLSFRNRFNTLFSDPKFKDKFNQAEQNLKPKLRK